LGYTQLQHINLYGKIKTEQVKRTDVHKTFRFVLYNVLFFSFVMRGFAKLRTEIRFEFFFFFNP